MPHKSPLRLLWFLLPLAVWAVVVGASFLWHELLLERHALALGTNQGRDIFRMIEAMRLWNARHGGLYALQSERAPPNPYLDVPERDPVTVSGKQLTMINPAYMTRQLGETIAEQTGIIIHITSLKPINPGNKPDSWEQAALAAFETGLAERTEIVGTTPGMVRYMAPLRTEKPCLACHAKQGYHLGDIRGGISVSFPAQAIAESLGPQRQNAVVVHLVAWLVLSLLGVLFLHRLRRHTESLEEIADTQEAKIIRRTAELRLEAAERAQAELRLRHLVNASGSGLLGLDAAGRVVFCNAQALRLLGLTAGAGELGSDGMALLAQVDARLSGLVTEGMQGHAAGIANLPVHDPEGKPLAVEVRVDPVADDAGAGGVVIALTDVTERVARHRAMWRKANFDTLTGLPNRELFLDRCERALLSAARHGEQLAVLFIDLDGFKPVNDEYGHACGDLVLIEVGRRLQQSVRDNDIVARLGGDEFIVALPGVADLADARAVGEKIVQALARAYPVDGIVATVSASVGVALFPDHGSSVEQLLAAADDAMYAAKESGRNQLCCAPEPPAG